VRVFLLALALTGCITNRVGPGVLREDWNQPRRDPDPTSNPTAAPVGNPWAPEHEERINSPNEPETESEEEDAPTDSRTVDFAKRGAATYLAWKVARWRTLLEYSGTFEEDPNQRDRLKKPKRKPKSKSND
jgi:hypothetical protein